MTPRRRLPSEPRCDRFLWCGLARGHNGDECAVLPQAGMQEAMAACGADGSLGGGAVGAGKSAILMLEPLRHVEVPGFTALILRKEQRDLERADGMWAKSLQLYPHFGGEPLASEYKWRWPSGATIQMGYIDSRTYERDHQGSRACYIGFDELTHFTLDQFLYMWSRNGSACGVEAYWRATCNPDRESWVRRLVDWWIADGGFTGPVIGYPDLTGGPGGWPRADRAGRVRYFFPHEGQFLWGDTAAEVQAQVPAISAEDVQTFGFFPGQLTENHFQNTRQRGRLMAQESAQRARWLGNWDAGDPRGKAFSPLWFRTLGGQLREDILVDRVPAGAARVRVWDLAATAEEDAASNSSYTAGPRMALHDGILYFEDLRVGRWGAAGVEQLLEEVAKEDGREVPIWICAERAGAGKRDMARWVRLLAGHDVQGEPETGDKGVRLQPLQALAERGLVRIVRDSPERRWNTTLVQHLLHLTRDGKGRPNDVGDAAAAGLDRLAEQGAPLSAEAIEAVVAANPGLITPTGGAPRFGAAPRTGVGPGRFRLR